MKRSSRTMSDPLCPMCGSKQYTRVYISQPSQDIRHGINHMDNRRKFIYICKLCKYSEEDIPASDKLDNSDLTDNTGEWKDSDD